MLQKPHNYTKCLFTEGGVKCGERTLPLARHCRKHILEDPNQVLFRSCGRVRADVECNTPVEAIFDDMTCKLHADIPTIKSYNQIRKDSESDYEDPAGTLASSLLDQSHLHLSSIVNIKSELSEFTSEVPKMESVPSMLFEDSANDTNEEDMDNLDSFQECLKHKLDKKEILENEEVMKPSFNLNEEQQEYNDIKFDHNKLNEELETQHKIEKNFSTSENSELENIESHNLIISQVLDDQLSKSDNDKTSGIDSPMEVDDGQLDESTDTASETMNETKKEVTLKDGLPSI
ncbi:hypothetical protein HHI36_001389 [Cryptolaemus montrouzieri]|uniref:KAT8 regulatory NSL complex subunit 2 n=1 Tax=Cryptolaemus montrouzieri TaxID=559131 RepID=A0ABD2P7I7_9CUCU